jgi:hypothetical protein
MKFQITGAGWPVGQYLIPASTIIDSNADDDWSRHARDQKVPPINSTPLDLEAYDAMVKHYPAFLHQLFGLTVPYRPERVKEVMDDIEAFLARWDKKRGQG